MIIGRGTAGGSPVGSSGGGYVAEFHLAVVPIGRLSVDEIEVAVGRATKILRQPVEMREPLPVPRGTEDPERGQHRAASMMNYLGQEVLKLKPGRLVGASDSETKTPFSPDGFLFVTDVDLYTANSEGVFGALKSAKGWAVISVRRLREAFHKRKADPGRQRSRLSKEILRMTARMAGLPECQDPKCALAPSRHLLDIDAKEERYCRVCEQKFFEGLMHI
jgi:predicted Zn-dependent protease